MSLYNDASLAMIPSAIKDGKLYSIRPTDGSGDFTFSRGTTATRVNASGLIEKGRENLFLQSNTFDTTWTTTKASVTEGQSGYDGSSDAWLLTATSTLNCRINQSISGSGVQTFSVYAKANTADFLALKPIVSGTTAIAYFDLSNGLVGTTNSAVIDTEIISIGSSWYRCSISFNDTNTKMGIFVVDADNSTAVTSGNSIYIQDSQLEQGLVATDYIETTTTSVQVGITDDLPRLDYSGGASCPSLLLEPQRTNLIQSTDYIADGIYGYSLSLAPTLTSGIISPSNEANAYNVTDFVALNSRLDCGTLVSAASAGTHTYSAYYKGSGSINIALNTTIGGGSGGNEKTITLTDEWVRHEITHTYDATDGGNIRAHIAITRTANNTASVDVAFPQIEAGNYSTSIIPTYGASVTRNADSCVKTGVSSLIGQTQGTLFGEFTFNSAENINRLFSVTGTHWSSDGSIRFDVTSNIGRVIIFSSGSSIASIDGTGLNINKGDSVKFALVYTATSLKLFINGAQRGSTATLSGSLPSTNQISIDALGGGFVSNTQNNQLNPYKQVLIFPTALTDSEAIALTTL